MIIKEMFHDNINRSINGVVKVNQDSLDVIKQEVAEYVVTKELKKHFTAFFNRYVDAFQTPTADVGVWISGFFGSGKSHFLKMLSYILENREIDGAKTAERFREKFDDPGTYMSIDRAVKEPAETILFNIDIEGPMKKDGTAVLRVFAKMFYNHLGFCGDDLKVALLERYLQQEGMTEKFCRTFEKKKGRPWIEQRKALAFNKKYVVSTLVEVLDTTETDAENWLKGEIDANYSIARLVEDVKKYVDAKPEDFRLLFMIDEVGQYVGTNKDQLLNLQSLVEEFGTKCGGKVWVVCTGQEAIDEIIKVRENEFSRIRARFKTSLSLSSSSVDEVIQKRVLKKKAEVVPKLEALYDKNDSVLRNLFTFTADSVGDVKGFSSASEFAINFPFVPYQFIIMQKVFGEIRKHGAAGKNMSGGERSMLSGFQEAAQAIQDKDEYALVPFYRFYDSVHSFLDGSIRRVIERCQRAADDKNAIEQYDVDVLKLLYLIRYIDDIKANLDNIVVLMADAIQTDKIELRKKTEKSLERLLSQNYIGRRGDLYNFLTDEEQDVQKEINAVEVDEATVVRRVAQFIYDDIYTSKKYRRGQYDFPFGRMVDGVVYGTSNDAIKLRFLTPASDSNSKSELALIRDSKLGEAIFVPENDAYYELLARAEKIRKYVKRLNISQLPRAKQEIVNFRQKEADELEKNVKTALEDAIVGATVYVDGERLRFSGSGVRAKIEQALETLVVQCYNKIDLVKDFIDSDDKIREILTAKKLVDVSPNQEAVAEVEEFLLLQASGGKKTTMATVQSRFQGAPYGWREIDVAGLVARLVRDRKVAIKKHEEPIRSDDPGLPDMLRKSSEIGSTVVSIRRQASASKIAKARKILSDYFGLMDVPKDEDDLRDFIVENFNEQKKAREALLTRYNAKKRPYPDKALLERSLALTNEILALKRDAIALIGGVVDREDALDDDKEATQKIEDFFKSQYQIFDDANETLDRFANEIANGYYANEEAAKNAIETLRSLVDVEKKFEYSNVPKYQKLLTTIREAHDRLIQAKRDELRGFVLECLNSTKEAAAQVDGDCSGVLGNANVYFNDRLDYIEKTDDLVVLDGFVQQIVKTNDGYRGQIEEIATVVDPEPDVRPVASAVDQSAADSGPEPPRPPKKNYRKSNRQIVFQKKILKSEAEIDAYLADARKRLTELLKDCDGIDLR